MPYYRCPECGLTTHSVAGRFAANACPDCSAPLSDADQVGLVERHPVSITRRFAAVPEAAAAARRVLDTLLWTVDAAEHEVLTLLVTELVANGIQHSGTPPDESLRLDVAATDDLVRVDVRDGGSGFVPAARTSDSSLASGWGLHLTETLADRWGVSADPHTVVWFELDRVAVDRAPRMAAIRPAVAVRRGREKSPVPAFR